MRNGSTSHEFYSTVLKGIFSIDLDSLGVFYAAEKTGYKNMEYLYHNLKKGNTESMVNTFLEEMNVIVVPFGIEEASKAAQGAIGNWDFSENARDYAIGSTAVAMDAILVTNNLKHFKWLENVVNPDEILSK